MCFQLAGTLVPKSYCTHPGVGVNTCVQLSRLRFDVHLISPKPFIILLSNLLWGYITYMATYSIQYEVTISFFSLELWVNLLGSVLVYETCVQLSRLRFDVHFISPKPFIILLSDLLWGYIRYMSTYSVQYRVTDLIFLPELWVNLLGFTFSCYV